MEADKKDAAITNRTAIAGERWLHFRKWLHQGRKVAALTPSGRALAEVACARIDPATPQVIVELGAGTGAITRAALARMHPSSRLLAIERDPDFARMLAATALGAEVVCDDAVQLTRILTRFSVDHVDVVINGLPTPSLSPAQQDALFAALEALPGNPWVSQLTVMPWVFRGFYQRRFGAVRYESAWRNLPPAGVYHCRGMARA